MQTTLERLRKLCQEASPGPWGNMEYTVGDHSDIQNIHGDTIVEMIEPQDAAFIVTARTALPLLLDLAEAQETFITGAAEWMESKTDAGLEKIRTALAAIESAKNALENLRRGYA